MMMRSKLLAMAFMFVLCGMTPAARPEENPTIAGTWELNVAASKTTASMPKSGTRTYTVDGNTEKMTATVVTADGKTLEESFTAAADGKEHPFQSQTMGVLTIMITNVDDRTRNFVLKKDGKDIVTGTRTIAQDGKSMTIASKGINAEGKPVEASMVYNRK